MSQAVAQLDGIVWNHEQQQALDQIRDWTKGDRQELSLSGPAGTGKTTILSAVKSMMRGDTQWSAMTGKAALRMSQAAGLHATTLHSALYTGPDKRNDGQLQFNKVANPKCKFLVVDESSMMSPKIYEDIDIWKRKGVQVLYVGDGYQLPPVMSPQETKKYGEDFSIFSLVPGPFLRTVMRSGDDIIRIATMLREENQVPTRTEGAFEFIKTSTPGTSAIDRYLKDPKDHGLITWRNAYRMEANARIRQSLGFKGVLPNEGEPVLLCKNGQYVLNGEIYPCKTFQSGPAIGEVETKWFHSLDGKTVLVSTQGKEQALDGFFPNIKDWREYGYQRGVQKMPEPIPVTYGYVLTAHKAQGSEFRRVTVFLTETDLHNPRFHQPTTIPGGEKMPFATRWLYTSATRAKTKLTLILGG